MAQLAAVREIRLRHDLCYVFCVSARYLHVPAIWLSRALHSPCSEALYPDVDDIRIARRARVLS
jgi:hypothetical protein